MTEVRISIIVPVFNTEEHLEKLLFSLLNQSEPAIEIIAVNDGSTDRCGWILHRAARRDPRVVVLSQSNGGVSAARNLGLERARGQWVAFADSDDWLAPTALATWLEKADRESLDFLVGNGFAFSGDPKRAPIFPPILKRQAWDEVMSGAAWIKRSVSLRDWRPYVWLQLVRRSFLIENKVRFFEGIAHEDILWTTELALAAQRVGFSGWPLYGYRMTPRSQTRDTSASAIHLRIRSYLRVMHELVVTAAAQNADAELRRALLVHSNCQSRHLVDLMVDRATDKILRREFAEEFFRLGLAGATFLGVSNGPALWRALRCWYVFSKAIMQGNTVKSMNRSGRDSLT